MDEFEIYLFKRINEFRLMLENDSNSESIKWGLINCMDELTDVLAQYRCNYKLN